jgi:hypothetical protein
VFHSILLKTLQVPSSNQVLEMLMKMYPLAGVDDLLISFRINTSLVTLLTMC